MCTMHAENLDSAVKRLTQKPMDISPAYIPLMNLVISVQRVHLVKSGVKKAYRRILSTNEIVDYENYVNVFSWDPIEDQQVSSLGNSALFATISKRIGLSTQDLIDESKRRSEVLHWMRQQKIRSYKEVARIIAEYYARPKEFYEKIQSSVEEEQVAAAPKI
jgi:flagellar protein FlaI